MSAVADEAGSLRVWRAAGLFGGIDVLRADYRRRSFAPHFHDDFTVGVVTRGTNRFRYGRTRLAAPAGSVCLAAPGEIHTGEADETGWSYWTAQIPASALADLAAGLGRSSGAVPGFASGVVEDAAVAARLTAFFTAFAAEGAALRAEVLGTEALGALIARHAVGGRPAAEGRGDAGLARRVRAVLADRAPEPVTLADLEDATGAGRFRLLRAFRAAYGLPPHAFQVQMRLARARDLLRAGMPVAEAAAAAGFADQAHMTRLFQRCYGLPPGRLSRAVVRPEGDIPLTPPGRGAG